MEPILDLKKVRGQRKRKTIRNVLLAIVVAVPLLVLSTKALAHRSSSNHKSAVSVNIPTSSTPQTTQQPTTSPTSGSQSQRNSQSQALEAQNLKDAQQNETESQNLIKSDQNLQQSLNTSATACAQNQQAKAQADEYSNEYRQLADDMGAKSQNTTLTYDPSSGISQDLWNSYWQESFQQEQQQSQTIEQQFNAAEAQVGGC
jgi:flagellar biosynthesis component FlhA